MEFKWLSFITTRKKIKHRIRFYAQVGHLFKFSIFFTIICETLKFNIIWYFMPFFHIFHGTLRYFHFKPFHRNSCLIIIFNEWYLRCHFDITISILRQIIHSSIWVVILHDFDNVCYLLQKYFFDSYIRYLHMMIFSLGLVWASIYTTNHISSSLTIKCFVICNFVGYMHSL